MIGQTLGSYQILSKLGEGGMGEVYRARDTKLGREVAIKVVLEAFIADRDRLMRFEREARSLAALNHPNIATLYGMEEANGRHFLVMELVAGQTMAERLASGPLPLTDAIGMALQIAEALEAAHEKGIVHRDLKPANVKITPDDVVKVLDFGLAKAAVNAGDARDPALPSDSAANSPTLTGLGTQVGVILGTASYMSPEQARGLSGDHRSDIFSFGVLLFEALTGRRPFQGESISDVLASVLARDPDLTLLPPDLSPRLTELVKRCLEKRPKQRWQAIGDVRHELDVIAANPRGITDASLASTAQLMARPHSPLWRRALPVLGAIVATAAVTAAVLVLNRPAPAAPAAPAITRFAIPFTENQLRTVYSRRPALAISSDGTRVAYVANRDLYVRTLSDLEPRIISRGVAPNPASTPFALVFSPDNRSLAYWDQADEKIKRIDLGGGPPVPVCSTPVPNGMTWSGDTIYFAGRSGLFRVPAAGGDPQLVVKVDSSTYLTAPQVLDDGRLLFSMAPAAEGVADRWAAARVVVQRPGDVSPTTLVEGGSDPRYLPSGHVVYQAGGVLFARTFDLRSGAVGEAVSVIEGVLRGAAAYSSGLAWYAVSANGTLVYMPGPVGSGELDLRFAWFERNGKTEYLPVPVGPYVQPRVSHDGKHLSFVRADSRETSVTVYDLAGGGVARRLTFGGHDRSPVWSADDQHVIFQSDRGGDAGLYWQRADGSGVAERLTTAEKDAAHIPQSASADVLLFDNVVGTNSTLMAYSFKDKKSSPYPPAPLGTIKSQTVTSAEFSPDGKWVAYSTREIGQTTNMVYVQPFPATGAKYQISTLKEDGHHAVWSADGRELFYTPGPGALLTAVRITTSPQFSYASGEAVARPFTNAPPALGRPYDVGRPTLRFLGFVAPGATDASDASLTMRNEMRVVVNWIEELKARAK